MPTSEDQFQPFPNVVYTQLDDSEAALLDLDTKRFYSLNETGSFIWHYLQEGLRPIEIAAALQEEYDIDQEQAANCVLSFLEELAEQKLVQKICDIL